MNVKNGTSSERQNIPLMRQFSWFLAYIKNTQISTWKIMSKISIHIPPMPLCQYVPEKEEEMK